MRTFRRPAVEADTSELFSRLDRETKGEVLTDPYSRHLYASDASMYAIEPLAVVLPRNAEDVIAAVGIASESGVPVLARGAGTSLAGQTVAEAIVLDFSRHMRRVVELDPEGRTAVIEPGVVQDELNRAAAKHGLMFGADTSTSNRATLGGMIGNNSSGTHSHVYGTTADHIAVLDVVLADASKAKLRPMDDREVSVRAAGASLESEIYRRLPEIVNSHAVAIERDQPQYWRHSGGYRLDRLVSALPGLDLAKFIVGTEGTLAIVTQAEVELVLPPRAQAMAVGHFASVKDAIAATADALSEGAAAAELMDRLILDLSRSHREYAGLSELLQGDPGALLFVTFFGEDEADAAMKVDRLAQIWRDHGHGYHTIRATSAAERAAVLKVRKAGLGLLMANSRGTSRPLAFVEDTAVPPEKLEEYVERFTEILERHGLTAGFYGHCSVGCLHIRPFVDVTDSTQVDTMRAVSEEIVELVIRFGGVNSSEHGDGLARSEFNERIFGRELYQAMRQVKQLFDPNSVLNPGKIVDSPPMTDNLRDALPPTAPSFATKLRFDEPGGMRGAADRCMNIGACRKTGAGTMCPSYMATLSEEHATRGRANALVKALSAPDPLSAMGDERLHDILDLCIECKACKSECPLSVDMASLKSEFLHHYHANHGVPIRDRFFGAVRSVNRLGSALAPASNLPSNNSAARVLIEKTLGISRHRPLPQFERETLIHWARRRNQHSSPAPSGEVVFLADCFTSYTETRVARAAIELLEASGWQVTIDDAVGCCGRSSFSKGLLDQARGLAEHTVARLAPYVEKGALITGCEPSCVLTLRDEYLSVLPDDPRAEQVAKGVAPIADLLLEALRDGSLKLADPSPLNGRRIVVHPHCHEKAVTGPKATVELMRHIPGAEVVELDVGCCGMAGSFGFETEHYEMSRTIGQLRLAPALDAERDDVLVAATGVSCRQQIGHLTKHSARHPLEYVRDALSG